LLWPSSRNLDIVTFHLLTMIKSNQYCINLFIQKKKKTQNNRVIHVYVQRVSIKIYRYILCRELISWTVNPTPFQRGIYCFSPVGRSVDQTMSAQYHEKLLSD
jgi:hypothetical protein